VAGFVVRGAAAFRFRDHDVPSRAQLDLLERISEIALVHDLLSPTGGEQSGFVGKIRQVGACHTGRRRRQTLEVDVVRKRNLARMDL
jgi:hypothetical protein